MLSATMMMLITVFRCFFNHHKMHLLEQANKHCDLPHCAKFNGLAQIFGPTFQRNFAFFAHKALRWQTAIFQSLFSACLVALRSDVRSARNKESDWKSCEYTEYCWTTMRLVSCPNYYTPQHETANSNAPDARWDGREILELWKSDRIATAQKPTAFPYNRTTRVVGLL